MEVPHGDKFMIATIIVEFVGILGYSLAVNLDDGTHVTALLMFTMILCIQGVSGGHINPALTLGVYIERNKFVTYACWCFSIMIAQMIGAIAALSFGWILRVTLPADSKGEEFYFVPG